tara:strand:+ start:892 stop:1152 length:261 start_codon:yes stop_codon:yes gene_type:complete
MKEYKISDMNEAEKKLFALFVAELMKNNIITDDDLLDFSENDVGEYVKEDSSGMVEVGPVVYDPRMADPPTLIRENVLERKNERKK